MTRSAAVAAAAVAAVAGAAAAASILLSRSPRALGGTDLIQYWAAARAFLRGADPYDPLVMAAVEAPVGLPDLPVLFWNPPSALTFVWWLAYLPFDAARGVWFALSVGATAAACAALSGALPRVAAVGPRGRACLAAAVATYYPLVCGFGFGQISAFVLLGLAAACRRSVKAAAWDDDFRCGLYLSVALLKPHLLYLVYLLLLVQTVKTGRARTALGFLTGALVAGAAPLLVSPDVWRWYAHAAASPPIQWRTPTLGSWLQAGTAIDHAFVRFVPSLTSAFLLLTWLLVGERRRHGAEVLFFLVPVSLLTSPYGWVYDQALLVTTLFWALSRSLRHADAGDPRPFGFLVGAFLQTHVLFYVIPSSAGQDLFVYYPAVVAGGALWFLKRPPGPPGSVAARARQ